MRLALTILPLAALAACGTPQERCLRAATADLRPIDRLIAETEGNISRGYALQSTTVYRDAWVPCRLGYGYGTGYGYPGPGGLCIDEQAVIIEQPVAIDIRAEERKLAQLSDKRGELAKAAAPAIRACQTLPDG